METEKYPMRAFLNEMQTNYVIKVTYVGDHDVLPGEPLYTFIRFKKFVKGPIHPYGDLFCLNELPSFFPDKNDAVEQRTRIQRMLDRVKNNRRTSFDNYDEFLTSNLIMSKFGGMEFFTRVELFDQKKWESYIEERQTLTQTWNYEKRKNALVEYRKSLNV